MMAMQTVARMTAKTSLLRLPMAMKTEVTTMMMPATMMGTRGGNHDFRLVTKEHEK